MNSFYCASKRIYGCWIWISVLPNNNNQKFSFSHSIVLCYNPNNKWRKNGFVAKTKLHFRSTIIWPLAVYSFLISEYKKSILILLLMQDSIVYIHISIFALNIKGIFLAPTRASRNIFICIKSMNKMRLSNINPFQHSRVRELPQLFSILCVSSLVRNQLKRNNHHA